MSSFHILYVIFFAASMANFEANERDWVVITIDEDLNQHIVDRSSIRENSENMKSAWVRYVYEKPPAHQPKLRSIEAYEIFDCAQRRRRVLRILAFLSDGKRVVEEKVLPWRDVTAGSSSELEFQFVCSAGSETPD
jgi:hypothetical protein